MVILAIFLVYVMSHKPYVVNFSSIFYEYCIYGCDIISTSSLLIREVLCLWLLIGNF
jgi:hypothetical protein